MDGIFARSTPGFRGRRHGDKGRWLAGAGWTIALAAALTAAPAAAQGQPASPTPAQDQPQPVQPGEERPGMAPGVDLGDVVVTARRVEERIQDVPVAVTALSQARLDALVVNNISDLSKLAPGLQVTACVSGSATGGASCSVNIRGFTSNRGSAFGTIAFYFADAADMFQSDYDLQNIQVLKGPQGTLFGDTVTGGAVLYTPRKPSGLVNDGFLTLEGGNYGYHQIVGAYETSVADGAISLRLSGKYRKRQGYGYVNYSFGGGEKVADVDQLWLRASLVVKPTEWLENYTVGLWQRDRTNGGIQPVSFFDNRFLPAAFRGLVPSVGAAANATATQRQEYALYEYWTGSAPPAGLTYSQIAEAQLRRQTAAGPDRVWSNVNAQFEQVSVGVVNQTRVSIGDHFYARNIFQLRWIPKIVGGNQNYDGIDAAFLEKRAIQFAAPNTSGFSDNYADVDNGWKNRQWTNELQLVGDMFNGRLQMQAGWYHREDRPGDFAGTFPYRYPSPQANQNLARNAIAGGSTTAGGLCPATGQCLVRLTTFQRHSDAFFGQATFAVTDRFKLTAGGRYSVISPGITKTRTFEAVTTSYTASNGFVLRMPVPSINTVQVTAANPADSVQPGYKSFTYTLTADWKPDDDTLIYIAHRTGFKAGGVNAQFGVGHPRYEYGPETVKDVEIGLKRDWMIGGMRARTNIAVYHDWYSDIQTNTREGGTLLGLINGGQARFKGIEFEGSISPTAWFTLSGQFSVQDNKYKEFKETTSCATQSWRQAPGEVCANRPGTTLIQIDHAKGILTVDGVPGATPIPAATFNFEPAKFNPPFTFSIRPEVNLEPFTGENIVLGANINYSSGVRGGIGIGASYAAGLSYLAVTDSVYGPIDNYTAYGLEGYTVVDLRADWRHIKGSAFSAFLSVTNLTNRRYRLGDASTFVSGGTAAPSPAEPRMIFGGVRYDF